MRGCVAGSGAAGGTPAGGWGRGAVRSALSPDRQQSGGRVIQRVVQSVSVTLSTQPPLLPLGRVDHIGSRMPPEATLSK